MPVDQRRSDDLAGSFAPGRQGHGDRDRGAAGVVDPRRRSEDVHADAEQLGDGLQHGRQRRGRVGMPLDQTQQTDVVAEDAVPAAVPSLSGHRGQIRLDRDVVHQPRHRTAVRIDHVERRGQVAKDAHAGHRRRLAVGVEGPSHLPRAACGELRCEHRPVRSGGRQQLDLVNRHGFLSHAIESFEQAAIRNDNILAGWEIVKQNRPEDSA